MNIYLDLNSIVDVMRERNKPFASVVKRHFDSGDRFIYSPAHIEEVANIYRAQIEFDEAQRYVHQHLLFIAGLTRGWEFLPCPTGTDGPAKLVRECPYACMRRVLSYYELTEFAENNETTLREWLSAKCRKTPEDGFCDEKVQSALQRRLWCRGYGHEPIPRGTALTKSHPLATSIIDACFRSLLEAGYDLEPRSKTRSSMHDVTHAIYASNADLFITRDPCLLRKSKTVYKYLDV